jgi:aspartate 1-decarboxylase
MQITLLKSKILRAVVTDANRDYEGSLLIDHDLMEAVGLLPYEKILVGNITNGQRFETYAISGPPGSARISLNGATAHLGAKGDLLVIMSFTSLTLEEAATWQPRTITLAGDNRTIIKKIPS